VWKFDRLDRSLPYLIETVTDLNARHIGSRSLTENIDTTTPGRAMLHLSFAAGLRVSELTGLRLEDLSLHHHASILVHGKGARSVACRCGSRLQRRCEHGWRSAERWQCQSSSSTRGANP
jgi:site-specific recombinase XerD